MCHADKHYKVNLKVHLYMVIYMRGTKETLYTLMTRIEIVHDQRVF